MKILVIDNYDSFVYNLVHYLEEFNADVTVLRNDQFAIEEVAHYDKILLSPGPGIPDEAGLFKNIVSPMEIGRYHSWVVNHENLPDSLEITAIDENGQIMALRHREFNIRGVQFHPESVLTPEGKKMIKNWIEMD